MRIEKIIEKAKNKPGFIDYLKEEPFFIKRKRIVDDVFSAEIGTSGTMRQIIYFLIEEEFGIDLDRCPKFSYDKDRNEPYCSLYKARPRCALENEICMVDDGME